MQLLVHMVVEIGEDIHSKIPNLISKNIIKNPVPTGLNLSPPIVDRFPNCFPQMMAATMDDMQAMSMSPDTKVQQ